MPARRTVSYGRIVAEIRPQKDEKYRTQITVGGSRINFPGDVNTPKANLTTAKLILNSVLLIKNKKIYVCRHRQFILEIPWTDMNIRNFHWKLFQLESSKNKTTRPITQSICVYGNPKRNVWTAPSRKNC